MHKNVLVIAAHPDDEALGCGGTIRLLADAGANIHTALLADGISSRDGGECDIAQLKARRSATRKAGDILGVQDIFFGDFPDNRMDTVALLDVVKTVEMLIDKYKPDTIFTHHVGDLNIDHRRVHESVVTACRPQTGHPVRTLLFFEIPSSTEWQINSAGSCFEPNWFSDISTSINSKIEALKAYELEMRSWPHPRSYQGVEYLSRWRGSIVGVSAAEAFVLGRRLS